MAFKMKGFSKPNGLPDGFYDSYKSAAKTNDTGQALNEQMTKTQSTKTGKFTPVYT